MTGASNPFWSQLTSDYLGLELDYCETIDIGGCSPIGAIARAAAAIDAGLCTTVFLLFADCWASENNSRITAFRPEWTHPYGLMGPPGSFGLITTRYEHQFGLKYEALAKLAVTQRKHSVLNPNACEKLRKEITTDDYLNSRMISEPIRLLDSVMTCEGATGLIVTSRKEAKRRKFSKFAVPLGYGERTNFNVSENLPDITESGHAFAGAKAMKAAGLKHDQISMIQPYDDFLIAMMIQFEMLGFCKRGQGSDYILDTDLTFKGDLPLNTGGGQISAGQIGLAGGSTNLIEGVRQLFGEGGDRQVPNPKNAMVTGIGWIPYARNWGTSAVMILAPDA
jgi:acetyl-CoA acetyltransferase